MRAWSAMLLCGLAAPCAPPAGDPVAVFAALEGKWAGTFVGYDAAGRELYRIRVEQEYRTTDANTQKVTLRDAMPDGVVVTGRGANVARRTEDGSLDLTCTVEKSNGDRVVHRGRLVEGPSGDEQIVWSSATEGRVETFREWVAGDVYHIHGAGLYDGKLMLMAGEYRRVRD